MNMNMIIGINVVAIDGNETNTVNAAQGRTHRKQSRRLIGNHFAREIDVKLSPKLTDAERQNYSDKIFLLLIDSLITVHDYTYE